MNALIYTLLFIVIVYLSIKYIRYRQNVKLLESVTHKHRGTPSERDLIIKLLKYGFSPSNIFHDLYIEKSPSHYSQVDAILITRVGIIVFEVKEYSGWIYGNGSHNSWTQVLAYGREKHRFYNPIMQNFGHIKALKAHVSEKSNIPFYSVIVFYGDCVFRSLEYIPENVYITHPNRLKATLIDILSRNPNVDYTNDSAFFQKLRVYTDYGGNDSIVLQHIRNVQKYSNLH